MNTPSRQTRTRTTKRPGWQCDFVSLASRLNESVHSDNDDDDLDQIPTKPKPLRKKPLKSVKPAPGHQLPHKLNHNKQLAKLIDEASSFSSCSCTIFPKDSRKQVTLNFSPPGYFLAVAVPALQKLPPGCQTTIAGHTVSCSSATPFYAGEDVERVKYW